MDAYTSDATTILRGLITNAMARAVAGQPEFDENASTYESRPYVTDVGNVKAHVTIRPTGGVETFYTLNDNPVSFYNGVEYIRRRMRRIIEGK